MQDALLFLPKLLIDDPGRLGQVRGLEQVRGEGAAREGGAPVARQNGKERNSIA
jgi:hypothetical protein